MRSAPACLLLLLFLLLPGLARADSPWDAPFAEETAALLAAAEARDPGDRVGVHALLDETVWTVGEDGTRAWTTRDVGRMLDMEGVAAWGRIYASWSPWYQDPPEVRARVIRPDGEVIVLDPATLQESRIQAEVDTYWDRRTLEGPLPGVVVGALVEIETRVAEHRPFFEAGTVTRHMLASAGPVDMLRLVLEHPRGVKLKVHTELLDRQRPRKGDDGLQRTTWELPDPPRWSDFDPWLPRDVGEFPSVSFSTGQSWQRVAATYSEQVEAALAGADLAAIAAEVTEGVDGRQATIQALVSWVQENVRYTGLHLGENALVPFAPATTIERGFGDCKDQSTLVVGLLRQAGIEAEIALLQSQGRRHPPDLPGLGMFDHAIVRVPGDPVLWIDPTDRFAPVGEVGPMLEGVLALIASPSTRGLIPINDQPAEASGWVERRELTIKDEGLSHLTETTTYRGWMGTKLRDSYSSTSEEARRDHLGDYVEREYGGTLDRMELTDPEQPTVPFGIEVTATDVTSAQAWSDEAWVDLPYGAVFAEVDRWFVDTPEDEEPRQADSASYSPHVVEQIWVVHPPAGYVPDPLPGDRGWEAPGVRFDSAWSQQDDGTVTARYRLAFEGRRFTPEELALVRAMLTELENQPAAQVLFLHRARKLTDAGRFDEALAALEGGDEALSAIRRSEILLAAGLGEAAALAGKRATELAPDSVRAHRSLAWALQHDGLGRRFGQGWDRDAVIAAYRRVLELDETDFEARADLAIVFEHDRYGRRYASGADLAGAAEQLERLTRDWDSPQMVDLLLVDLLRLGRWQDVLDRSDGIGTDGVRRPLVVAARAAKDGPAAGLTEARRQGLTPADVDVLAGQAYLYLLQAGHLAEAAEFGLARAARHGGVAPEIERVMEVVRLAADFEPPEPPFEPEELILALALTMIDPAAVPADLARMAAWADGQESVEQWELLRGAMLKEFDGQNELDGASPETVLALAAAQFETTVKELDVRTAVVRHRVGASSAELSLVAVRWPDGWRWLGGSGSWSLVGQEASTRLRKKRPEQARELLEQVSRMMKGAERESSFFPKVWFTGIGPVHTPQLAADVLACSQPAPECLRAIEAQLDEVTNEVLAEELPWFVYQSWLALEDWESALRLARYLMAREADLPVLRTLPHTSLVALGRLDEAAALREKLAQSEPPIEEDLQLRMRSVELSASGDLAALLEVDEQLHRQLGEDSWLNEMAWNRLLLGTVDERTLELARQGSRDQASSTLHTLASVLAELERPQEARGTLLRSMEVRGRADPEPHDWYVIGRIAEHYGATVAARRAYLRAESTPSVFAPRSSAWELARRRLEGLEGE